MVRLCLVLGLLLAGVVRAEPPPVLSPAPGAGTPYGAAFPDWSLHDRQQRLVNLTTPESAATLARLAADLDAPIGGQRLGAPIYIVDEPPRVPGDSYTAEASPRGAVIFYRDFLSKLAGVPIDAARPESVNAALAAIANNPRAEAHFRSIVAHELGHLTQGHGRFDPGTAYARRAAQAADALKAGLSGPLFTLKLDETNRHYKQARLREDPRAVVDQPSVGSHVDEYLADQHAMATTYLARRDLRAALDFWNEVPSGRGRGPAVEYAHPTMLARILNGVSFVEANPDLFAGALEKPLSLRPVPELPPLTLERVDGKIRVSGREALVDTLSPPERLVFDRYQKARASYYRKTGSRLYQALYPEEHRHQRTEPEVLHAYGAGGAAGRALASLKTDFARGGIFVGPALAVVTGVAQRMAGGQSLAGAVEGAARAAWSVDTAVDAVAGTAGAALGAVLPVPGWLGHLRLVGGVARSAPALAGAMVAARLAGNALALHREGRLDASTLVKSIDWTVLGAQVLGSAIGMSLAGAAISAGLLPALALGPVALVPLAAGIAGGVLAEKLVAWWRSRSAATVLASSGAPATGPAAPAEPAASGPPAAATTAAASRSRASGPDDAGDPFGDLRRRDGSQ